MTTQTAEYRHRRSTVVGRQVTAEDPTTVRITAWRAATTGPTVQGYAVSTAAGWRAEGVKRGQATRADLGTYPTEKAATAALLRHRSGLVDHEWTAALTPIKPARPAVPSCTICGHEMPTGVCRRTDLHW
ncbi:MAG: hypothetical protein HOV87_11885 [Catenulispora sp.]|nr:hypothetical protein [Catenulispora sp.]NUT43921.1 hypothetical protein [Thermoactinospora sp.]